MATSPEDVPDADAVVRRAECRLRHEQDRQRLRHHLLMADRLASPSYPANGRARRAIASWISILAGLVLAATGCGPILPTAPSTGPDYTLNVNNDTTLVLTIVVNGQPISAVGAKTAAAFQP